MKPTKSNLSPSLVHHSRGATLVEFSLCVGVFFMIVFATLEVARYMSIRGSLLRAAQAALAIAQRTDRLLVDLRPCDPANSTFYSPAEISRCLTVDEPNYRGEMVKLSNKAVNLATMTFSTPNTVHSSSELAQYQVTTPTTQTLNWDILFLRPGDSGNQLSASGLVQGVLPHPTKPNLLLRDSWLNVLKNDALRVALRTEVHPLLPWPVMPSTFYIEAVADGYAEVPRTTHIPPQLGAPFPPISTTTTTTTTVQTTLPCVAPASTWCSGACYNSSCGTPPNTVWNQGTCSCTCPAQACTPPTPIWDYVNCMCVSACTPAAPTLCNGNCYDSSCPISPYTYWNSSSCTCECPPTSCGPNYTLDPITCQCVCNSSGSCSSPKTQWNTTSCQCECPPPSPACQSGEVQDPNTCQCVPVCSAGNFLCNSGSCHPDCSPTTLNDPANCNCSQCTSSEFACNNGSCHPNCTSANQVADPANCTCKVVCLPNETICPGDGQCYLPCPSGQGRDTVSCICKPCCSTQQNCQFCECEDVPPPPMIPAPIGGTCMLRGGLSCLRYCGNNSGVPYNSGTVACGGSVNGYLCPPNPSTCDSAC